MALEPPEHLVLLRIGKPACYSSFQQLLTAIRVSSKQHGEQTKCISHAAFGVALASGQEFSSRLMHASVQSKNDQFWRSACERQAIPLANTSQSLTLIEYVA